jgi:acyl-CoA thioesterase FadM
LVRFDLLLERSTVHAAARYFERHRTTFLGGPAGLQSLADAGVSVVVARINGFRLLPAAHATGIGEPLELRCRVSLKARGTQIVFQQWLLHGETAEPLARARIGEMTMRHVRDADVCQPLTRPRGALSLAGADVTCLCLDAETGRMCSAPAEAVARIERWLAADA